MREAVASSLSYKNYNPSRAQMFYFEMFFSSHPNIGLIQIKIIQSIYHQGVYINLLDGTSGELATLERREFPSGAENN